jgi:hypothetical protein
MTFTQGPLDYGAVTERSGRRWVFRVPAVFDASKNTNKITASL